MYASLITQVLIQLELFEDEIMEVEIDRRSTN
jgi:hypothetical protein